MCQKATFFLQHHLYQTRSLTVGDSGDGHEFHTISARGGDYSLLLDENESELMSDAVNCHLGDNNGNDDGSKTEFV